MEDQSDLKPPAPNENGSLNSSDCIYDQGLTDSIDVVFSKLENL